MSTLVRLVKEAAQSSATLRGTELAPATHRRIQQSGYEYNSELTAILVEVSPSITARKGRAARAIVVKALENYLRDEGYKRSSILGKNRHDVPAKNRIAPKDIVKCEVGGAVAILVNPAPAAFWTLFFIYSTPGLLDDIRSELDSIMVKNDDGHGLLHSVDIKSVKQHCTLRTSAFQKTLRYCSIGTSIRQVMEDTVLDGQ